MANNSEFLQKLKDHLKELFQFDSSDLDFGINKYKFVQDNGRKYVFVFGERNSRKTAIIWRPTKGMDLTKDKEVIDSGLNKYESDEIFINGDSFIKGYKLIESEFKALVEVMK